MLSVRDASVRFGQKAAVDGLDLDVAKGEVLALLGPSGCGKSTLLRSIAGLQPLNSGWIAWEGADLAEVPVHQRDFGLMFQDHALFAHRSVADNIAFGLKMRGQTRARQGDRVEQILSMVGLQGFASRATISLSGGEAQRVALARSLAPEPRLLMLDEPLGSLDRRLRDELVDELRRLFRDLDVTVLHVTHDHDEAFAIGDRLAVMMKGRIARIGTPEEVWLDPRRADVARFLGHENVVPSTVGWLKDLPNAAEDGQGALVVVRSDAFRRTPEGAVEAVVTDCRFRGDRFELRVDVRDGDHHLLVIDADGARPGDIVRYEIDPAAVVVVEREK